MDELSGMREFHHIAIEGPLGVGKTSLAALLAERLNGRALLEETEENPFLANFYKHPAKYAFQTQIYFLLKRYEGIASIGQIGLFEKVIVTDFLIEKDRVFARINLEDSEFWLYDQLFRLLRKRLSPPDLVIFLQARTEVLMDRIRKRGRKFERGIGYDYLEKINAGLNDLFFHYEDSPLLVVNASEIDFVNVPGDLDDLIREMRGIKAGTQYYVPLGSKG
jgi:deoxyadenosine/deoxycytidine kinase